MCVQFIYLFFQFFQKERAKRVNILWVADEKLKMIEMVNEPKITNIADENTERTKGESIMNKGLIL